jgi:hypothetical protein
VWKGRGAGHSLVRGCCLAGGTATPGVVSATPSPPPLFPADPSASAFLQSAQARIDSGQLRLQDLLGIKAEGLGAGGGAGRGGAAGGGVAAALQDLLGNAGQLTKVGLNGGP